MKRSSAVSRQLIPALVMSLVIGSLPALAQSKAPAAEDKAAATLRVDPPGITLEPGQTKRATIHVAGKNGWTGAVEVKILSGRGLVVVPDSFALDSLPGHREITISTSPHPGSKSDGQIRIRVKAKGHGKALDEAVLRAEVKSPAGVADVSSESTPAVPAPTPKFALKLAHPTLKMRNGQRGRVQLEVKGLDGWNGPVSVEAQGPHWTIIQPGRFMVRTPGSHEVQVMMRGQGSPGKIVFTAAAGSVKQTIELPLEFDASTAIPGTAPSTPPVPSPLPPPGGNVVARPAPAPPMPGAPLADSGLPVPPIPPQFGTAADGIRTANLQVDGLVEAVTANPVIDPQRAAQQVGMLKFYEGLLDELRSPTAFAMSAEDPGIDPAVLIAMIEASGVYERDEDFREALSQVASLGVPPVLFQSDFPLIADRSALPTVRPGQPVDFTTARGRIETLILQLKLARVSEGMQKVVTGPARQAVDALNDAISKLEEKLGEDKTPGRAKRALKQLMIATAAITLADVVAKASIAYLPNEITAFYAEINGLRRNEGDPPITIEVGQKVPIRVLIETRSPGGSIATPSEVAGWIFGAVSSRKEFDAFLDKMLGLNKASVTDSMKKEVRDEFIKKVESIWTKVTGLPGIKEWFASLDKKWDIKPFDNKAIEVNSNRVLFLESRSPALIRIGESGAFDKTYFIEGKAAGEQAGYHVALKKDLIEELMTMSRAQLGRNAVVNVGKSGIHPNAGKRCAMNEQNPGVVVPDGPCTITIFGACWCPN